MRVMMSAVAMIAVMAGILMAQVPTDGLVAFYPFTGDWNDASGHGNHLTTIPEYAPTACADRNGVTNRADSFYNAGDGLHAPVATFPMGSSPRTLSAWVQTPGAGTPKTIMSWGTNTSGNGCILFIKSNTALGRDQIIFTNRSDSLIYTTASLYKLQQWTHLAVTLSASGSAVMYMGDSVIATKTMTGWNTSGGEFFGVGAHFGDQYTKSMGWAGKLDAIAVYNRALSASEISLLADNYTDQLITTGVVRPANANYSLVKTEPPTAYYTIAGRTLARVPAAGISVGSGLVKILRLR